MKHPLMNNADIAPGDGYSLRKVKGQDNTGEVAVSAKSIKRIGGVKAMARRIVDLWESMPERYRLIGWTWYDDGHAFACDLAEVYDHTTWQTAQVISVLSPQNPWDGKRNKDGDKISDGNRVCALNVCKAWAHGGAEAVRQLRGWGYAPDFVEKAIIVLSGGTLDWSTAPKTHRFALLLDNPKLKNIVVCDSHASRIATGNLGGRYHVVLASAYALIERAYILAARLLGIPAYVLQAGTWQMAADGLLY